MKSGSGAFDVDDFVAKLLRFMGGQNNIEDALPEDDSDVDEVHEIATLNWDRIGRKALAKSRRVPAMGFMLVFFRRWSYLSTEVSQARASFNRAEKEDNC